MPQGTCARCSAPFSATTTSKRYCSERCRKAVESGRREARKMVLLGAFRCGRCEQTKDAVSFAPSHRTNGGYCRLCNRAYQHERYQAADKTCRRCGDVFVRWSTAKHPGQAGSHCQGCYNELVRERYERRIGHRPGGRRRVDYDPITKTRPQGRRWNDLRRRVIAEESVCWICAEPVDKTLFGVSSKAPSVDHVHPLDLGGSYWDRDNLRLAHFGCNAGRSNAALALKAAAEREAGLLAALAALTAEIASLRGARGEPEQLRLVG